MFSFQNMGRAIDYIELNLCESLTINEIALVAHYSPFHFQRLFQLLTSSTVGDYIRNRRLSNAGKALLTSDIKIVDLALNYQYESPEAFTRAFKKLYGVNPSTVRKEHLVVKHYPKLSVQVKLTAEEPLNYRLIEKDILYIKGYHTTFTANEIMEGIKYPEFWQEHIDDIKTLQECYNKTEKVGAGSYRADDSNVYDAVIGILSDSIIEGALVVEPSKWVMFKGKGPVRETLHNLWSRIFLEWFPQTSFQHSGLTEIEVFPCGDSSSVHYTYEIWIPLKGAIHETS